MIPSAQAHHVLGRPSYSLNEDSNTPPTMEVETQIGSYFVTITAFPAFPKPGQLSLIKLYATHLDDDTPFSGPITFSVMDDLLWGGEKEQVGIQQGPIDPDEGVYTQGVVFQEDGDYILNAYFEAGGEPYAIDLPIRIGAPFPYLPLGLSAGVVILVLGMVSVVQRKKRRRMQEKKARVKNVSSDDSGL
ncbi:MAG: hypothetical protein HQL53_14465 [Magnetococcales bacterium]|nr:hypothetical protein [Magnetococcales bacterium]